MHALHELSEPSTVVRSPLHAPHTASLVAVGATLTYWPGGHRVISRHWYRPNRSLYVSGGQGVHEWLSSILYVPAGHWLQPPLLAPLHGVVR
jgi:hypothetical protein